MKKFKIPFYSGFATDSEVKAVVDTVVDWQFGVGKYVNEFEKGFGGYISAPYVITTDSVESALYLIMLKELPEKIQLPASYNVNRANALLMGQLTGGNDTDFKLRDGGHPYKEVNIQTSTCNIIDCSEMVKRDQWLKIKEKYQKKTYAVYEFSPHSMIPSSRGGAIVTDDVEAFEWFRAARNCGIDDHGTSRFPGLPMYMDNMAAAIALKSIKSLPERSSQLDKVFKRYNAAFGQKNSISTHYRLRVHVDKDEFIKKMAEDGIVCTNVYRPLYWRRMYQDDYSKYPNTEKKSYMYVDIPSSFSLNDYEVEYIIERANKHRM